MRFFKMNVYVSGDDYETRESLIDEETFRKYQKAIAEGSTHLILEDRVIKVSLIKEILPADEIVKEYIAVGISLKELGFKEPIKLKTGEQPQFQEQGLKKISESIKEVYGK